MGRYSWDFYEKKVARKERRKERKAWRVISVFQSVFSDSVSVHPKETEETGGCFTNAFRALQDNPAQIHNAWIYIHDSCQVDVSWEAQIQSWVGSDGNSVYRSRSMYKLTFCGNQLPGELVYHRLSSWSRFPWGPVYHGQTLRVCFPWQPVIQECRFSWNQFLQEPVSWGPDFRIRSFLLRGRGFIDQ